MPVAVREHAAESPVEASRPLDAGMVRKCYWRLEVHFWPVAVERNERPLAVQSFSKDDPGNYSPHDFDFEKPPSKEEFAWLVNCLPWAWNCWHDSLLPLLEQNEWPVVEASYKRAEMELRDGTPGRREVCPRCGKDIAVLNPAITNNVLRCDCGELFKITKQPNKQSKHGQVMGRLVVSRQTLYSFNGSI